MQQTAAPGSTILLLTQATGAQIKISAVKTVSATSKSADWISLPPRWSCFELFGMMSSQNHFRNIYLTQLSNSCS